MRNYLAKYSRRYDLMVVNPEKVKMGSLRRVAINKDDKYQYPKVKSFSMRSFLAFDININVLRSARFLRVLELRKSVVQETVLERMVKLRYLGLRGCNISELPKNIRNMKSLQTLYVRDAKKSYQNLYGKSQHFVKFMLIMGLELKAHPLPQ
jgi:hypothetical protein